ncbi:MAG: type B 50S ribosomal protein L31 [Gemmatimonadetes bacterium]|nr:type B 50S ribosomal protein L31 [Gemmatimonadota bacterium]
MKDDIHPEYRPVVFKDDSTGYTFLTRSTMSSDKVIKWEDGTEYPLVKLDISSSSHPFYTGQQRLVDTAGRVERFRRRYSQRQEKVEGADTKEEGAAASDRPADASTEEGGAGAEQ